MTSYLDKEAEENNPIKNPFKIVAFSKAIKAISNVEHPIRSGSAVMDVSSIRNHIKLRILKFYQLPGVGPRIRARIDEYLCSDEGSYHRPSYIYYPHSYLICLDPETQSELRKSRALNVLQDVPGIGYLD
jgi:DNA polymerase beta